MKKVISTLILLCAGILMFTQCSQSGSDKDAALTDSSAVQSENLMSDKTELERGKYLVGICGCDDCHSPKMMTPEGPVIDSSRRLSGHPADMKLPEVNHSELAPGKWILAEQDLTAWAGLWGVSFAVNLTPDSATGTGAWTPELFIKILRSGKFMGIDAGRPILPPMPWQNYGQMTDSDLRAIFSFLRSLPPISNKVPDPLPPVEMKKG